MKTSINLYVEELRPKKYYLTLTNIALVTSILFVSMLVWFGSLFLENRSLNNKIDMAQVELENTQNELQEYQKLLLEHSNKASFISEKNKLERIIEAKKSLIKIVDSQSDQDAVDYYQVMKDLTEHHDHDIWLTHFRFNQNDASFAGYALQSKAVTNWLSYLQATSSFKGREFSVLEINEHNEQVVGFKTATSINAVEVGADE